MHCLIILCSDAHIFVVDIFGECVVFTVVCLFVYVFVSRITQKLLLDFREIWGIGTLQTTEKLIRFCK